MTTTAFIEQNQMVEITRAVWSPFLGMTLRQVETSESSTKDGGQSATASVHISGGWNGSVILSCSTTLAKRAAVAMFESGTDDIADEEIADAFGEMVNMIGGNLKCLLPEPSQLSLPMVSMGAAHVVTVPGARLVQHIELECDGDRLHVALWNRREDRNHDEHVSLEE